MRREVRRPDHPLLLGAERDECNRSTWRTPLPDRLRDREHRGDTRSVVVRAEVAVTDVIVMGADEDDLVADVWVDSRDESHDVCGRAIARAITDPKRLFESIVSGRREAQAREALDDMSTRRPIALGAG